MSDELTALLVFIGVVVYGVGALLSFMWGHITYTTTLDYPMLAGYEWEKRWGARGMIFCWAWPALVAAMYLPKAGRLGKFIGGVFRDGMKR